VDYKRYVLPIIFLRFLSLRYDRPRAELETQSPIKLATTTATRLRSMTPTSTAVSVRSSSGRRDAALYRGLDVATQQLVPQALALLRREGLLVRAGQGEQVVWLPTKSSEARRRALSILAAPSTSTDPVMLESGQFQSIAETG
jgi:hypothetical protein